MENSVMRKKGKCYKKGRREHTQKLYKNYAFFKNTLFNFLFSKIKKEKWILNIWTKIRSYLV